eukprot:SM000132S26856  [mRNA]  locus=s132:15143:26031:- [translate_table: standard]
MDESDIILSAVTDALEQLRTAGNNQEGKQKVAMQLDQLTLHNTDARAAIGYNAQAIPLLVALLRTGTLTAKTCATAILGSLCTEDELRVKVLLGGCIPPMLQLLKIGPYKSQVPTSLALIAPFLHELAGASGSGYTAQSAGVAVPYVAAKAVFAVSKQTPARDQVGKKIFTTEGVVTALLEQLKSAKTPVPRISALLTGTLRNLCEHVEGFWEASEEAGGIEVFTGLLSQKDNASNGKLDDDDDPDFEAPDTQEQCAALLASYLVYSKAMSSMEDDEESSILATASKRVVQAGAVAPLLKLLEPDRQVSAKGASSLKVAVRMEAAGALRALSEGGAAAREAIRDAKGESMLIRATVAPSSEMMQVKAIADLAFQTPDSALASYSSPCSSRSTLCLTDNLQIWLSQSGLAPVLQENSVAALSNLAGGKREVVLKLTQRVNECTNPQDEADSIGALAHALMVLDVPLDEEGVTNPGEMEATLGKRLQKKTNTLVQERAIEALSSLYGNAVVAKGIQHADAKRMLTGLITLSAPEGQADLLQAQIRLCSGEVDLWEALKGRDGVQQLVALLGLSTEDQQEYAASLFYILTVQKDESKWAITAAGGIPPLVQLLGTGTSKAREDAAAVLGNLCSYSEDIRACVETAEATPALLSLLGSGSPRAQMVSARALTRLVRGSSASSSTVGQLTAMLVADLPVSKASSMACFLRSRRGLSRLTSTREACEQRLMPSDPCFQVHVLRVLGHLLAESPDVAEEGSASNEALQTLVLLLDSEREESQESSAAVLANLFAAREDLRESLAVIQAIPPLVRLVDYGPQQIAMQAARALAAVLCSIDTNFEAAAVARDAIFPLVKLAKSSATNVAEVATTALANLLANEELAQYAPAEEVVVPLTRVLREGTEQGKEHAAGALAHLLHSRVLDDEVAEAIVDCGAVLALVALLACSTGEEATMAALEALAALARARSEGGFIRAPLQVLSDTPYSISPLVTCLATGTPVMQERAIEVVSRLCKDQPVVLGDLIAGTADCIAALTERITTSPSLEVKVGGTALLICAAKEHRQQTMEAMVEAGTFTGLVQCLVDLLANRPPDDADGTAESSAALLANSVSLWLLAVIASHDNKSKVAVADAGAVEVLTEKLAIFSPNAKLLDDNVDDNGGSWVTALLLAILFCDADLCRSAAASRAISPLSNLLRSTEPSDRYFAAQALASLVCCGSRGTLLAVANSGAVGGLITMLGNSESGISNLLALAEEFSLARNPEQVALERLFRCDDIRGGGTARKSIPALVDLLKPHIDRPGAPPLALGLLTQIAKGNNINKLATAEAGALEALTKYLSIGPQDAIEEAASELLRILFSSEELRVHPSAFGAVEQLVVVLQVGTRAARYSSARALMGLFEIGSIRGGEVAGQAVGPLVDMLSAGLEKERLTAVSALVRLTTDNLSKINMVADAEGKAAPGGTVPALCKILSTSDASIDILEETAALFCILFQVGRVRMMPVATAAIEPLVALLSSESVTVRHRAAAALDNLLDDESQAENLAAKGAVAPLVVLLSRAEDEDAALDKHNLYLTVTSALFKLARDRRMCRLDMVALHVIERALEILPSASDGLAALFCELLRVLTNNGSIAAGSAAGAAVLPLLGVLQRPGLPVMGQSGALQALTNMLEKPARLAAIDFQPALAIGPLLPLMGSKSLAVKQLSSALVAHLLSLEHFQRDTSAQGAMLPLVRLLASDMEALQKEGLRGLDHACTSWPNAIADAGGVEELSRLVATSPQPVWQLAATVLTGVLRARAQYYGRVPLPVLVRLLLSNTDYIQRSALQALLALERVDASRAERMADIGVVEALLELLRGHQVEEPAARLLEALFNNTRVRELPSARAAIQPLATYLQDPESQDLGAKLLATLALGDLFQDPDLSRTSDASSACRALVSVLEDQASEDLQTVAVCALQNLVVNSRANKRALAEAGGVHVMQGLLMSGAADIAGQAASLLRLLFCDGVIQEYASSDIISSLAGALERELWKSATCNCDCVHAIEVLLQQFHRLRPTEAATAAIPVLIGAMKVGPEAAQESALNCMYLLSEIWPDYPELAQSQAMATAEAIPVLQLMLQSGPVDLYQKAEFLLSILPGSLVVTLKRGNNLKLAMGTTNAYCRVQLGDMAPQETTVVANSSSPEWKQTFTWALNTPPAEQRVHILCKSKNALGKGALGKVAIQIDRVITMGTVSGTYTLLPESNRDGSARTLDIEFQWTNRLGIQAAE